MSSFSVKTGDHLLGSASCANKFCWIGLIWKHPYSRLLFTFGLIRVHPRFTTCHDVIEVFRSTVIVFLEHFFRPIDTSLFLGDSQIVCDSEGSCSCLLEYSTELRLYVCILILVCPFFPHACCYWFTGIVFDVFVSCVLCTHCLLLRYIFLLHS